jgi:hypothetical protein
MLSPGLKNLGDVPLAAINAATTATVVTSSSGDDGTTIAYIDGLDGMLGATLQANFNWGAGAGTLKVLWEVSLDQGQTWIEVCRMAFAAASEENIVNLSGLTPVTGVYTPAALSDDSVKDGVFGDRWRARILKAGADYTGNTSLSLRMNAR